MAPRCVVSIFALFITPLYVSSVAQTPHVSKPSTPQAPASPPTSIGAQILLIPDVVGKTFSVATDILRWTELRIIQLDTVVTSGEPGLVVRQRPAAGTPLSRARAETLLVAVQQKKPSVHKPNFLEEVAKAILAARDSAGVGHGEIYQNVTTVPDLTGRTPPMVMALLRKSELKAGQVGQDYSDQIETGRVFRQHPLPGTEVVTGSEVMVWYSAGPHPSETTLRVPSVIALTLSEAADSLKRSRLSVGHVDSLKDRKGEGKVLRQTPHEGEIAHPKERVDLIVTIPVPQVEVPSITGISAAEAEQEVARAGLTLGRITLVADENQRLGVISQSPAAKTLVDSGTMVDIVNNRPPEVRYAVVPSLIGESATGADSVLQAAHFVLGEVVRLGIDRADRVTDQEPKAGTRALVRSAVNIALGNEPPVPGTIIPDVVNMSVDSARRILSDSGFLRLSIDSRGDRITSKSIIESQRPAGGTPAPVTTMISLVAIGLPVRVVPDLVGRNKNEARMMADIDSLRIIVTSELRRLRFSDRIVDQSPIAFAPRPDNGTIDVTAEIPIIPPFLAGMLGFTAVAGAGWQALRKRPPKTPKGNVELLTVTQPSNPPILDSNNRETLISAEYTLRFDVATDPIETETSGESIIKSSEVRNV